VSCGENPRERKRKKKPIYPNYKTSLSEDWSEREHETWKNDLKDEYDLKGSAH